MSAKKQEREEKVLLGLIDLYIKTARPVGSQTLQECGFSDLSSATIRNYFARLEKEGFLTQAHASGGRMPTDKAFHFFAAKCLQEPVVAASATQPVREVAALLDREAERLSRETRTAVVITSPRFDHDFIRDIRIVVIDDFRILAVLITDFGLVKSEVIATAQAIDAKIAARLEANFLWHIRGREGSPAELDGAWQQSAQELYQEIMVRFLVGYSHFPRPDLHKKGFSTLLSYPECGDPVPLAEILGLFEQEEALFALAQEAVSGIKLWIGSDLSSFGCNAATLIAMPYHLHQKSVGMILMLAPTRMDYKKALEKIQTLSQGLSEHLTASLYTFKLSYREPNIKTPYVTESERRLLT